MYVGPLCEGPHYKNLYSVAWCHAVFLMGKFSPGQTDIHCIDLTLFVFTLSGLTSAGLLYSKRGGGGGE